MSNADDLPTLPHRFDIVDRRESDVPVWNSQDMHAYARAAIAAHKADALRLREAAETLMSALEKEAKAQLSYENARVNFSDGGKHEGRAHEKAILVSVEAIKAMRAAIADSSVQGKPVVSGPLARHELASILVSGGFVDADAYENPEGYDDCRTMEKIGYLTDLLNARIAAAIAASQPAEGK